MSEEVQEQPQQEQQPPPQPQPGPAPDRQRAQCLECQQPFMVKTPSLRFINTPEASLLVMGHGRPDVCHNCGATYVPTMKGLTETGALNIQYQRVDVEHSPIVAPTQQQTAAVQQTKGAGGLIIP